MSPFEKSQNVSPYVWGLASSRSRNRSTQLEGEINYLEQLIGLNSFSFRKVSRLSQRLICHHT